MSIKVKSTAVAIATASSVFSFSVPSQAGEYGYLDQLEKTAEYVSQQEGVNRYLDDLSASEKLERGKEYCERLEYFSVNDIIDLLGERTDRYLREGIRDQLVQDFYEAGLSILVASATELCPEYEHKIDNFISENSEEKEI